MPRLLAVAVAVVLAAGALTVGAPKVAANLRLSASIANWITSMVVYAAWGTAVAVPWVLREGFAIDSAYWRLGSAEAVSW